MVEISQHFISKKKDSTAVKMENSTNTYRLKSTLFFAQIEMRESTHVFVVFITTQGQAVE